MGFGSPSGVGDQLTTNAVTMGMSMSHSQEYFSNIMNRFWNYYDSTELRMQLIAAAAAAAVVLAY
ncbi:hypothetical protein [Oryza sativa Japonica Group]|uniref:Uncharacterized protein n=1 Tax=Oryza sativa subsp. japonica TaxID=39947 RepID=Q5VR33_ORYSJ|nr:hypothetical protein [Oryza sativa Japonica Group]